MQMLRRTRVRFMLIAAAAMIAVAGCGGGGGGDTPGTTVSLNTISGRTDVPVDAIFTYTFSQTVNSNTVSGTSFFMVPAPAASAQVVKDAFDPTVCNVANAIAATVSCTNIYDCQLAPAANLTADTSYAACLTSAILYSSGTPFEGFTATFTTAGSTPTGFTA